MDYHVWSAMLEAYNKLKTKPKTFAELKKALQIIWGNLPQNIKLNILIFVMQSPKRELSRTDQARFVQAAR